MSFNTTIFKCMLVFQFYYLIKHSGLILHSKAVHEKSTYNFIKFCLLANFSKNRERQFDNAESGIPRQSTQYTAGAVMSLLQLWVRVSAIEVSRRWNVHSKLNTAGTKLFSRHLDCTTISWSRSTRSLPSHHKTKPQPSQVVAQSVRR